MPKSNKTKEELLTARNLGFSKVILRAATLLDKVAKKRGLSDAERANLVAISATLKGMSNTFSARAGVAPQVESAPF